MTPLPFKKPMQAQAATDRSSTCTRPLSPSSNVPEWARRKDWSLSKVFNPSQTLKLLRHSKRTHSIRSFPWLPIGLKPLEPPSSDWSFSMKGLDSFQRFFKVVPTESISLSLSVVSWQFCCSFTHTNRTWEITIRGLGNNWSSLWWHQEPLRRAVGLCRSRRWTDFLNKNDHDFQAPRWPCEWSCVH